MNRILGFACGVMLSTVGCNSQNPQHQHGDSAAEHQFQGTHPIKVVCTTGPVADMVRALGGVHLDVQVIMGPGTDPHSYQALPSDNRKFLEADIIFYNGLHLEGRLGTRLEAYGKKVPVVAVTKGLEEAGDARLRKAPEFQGNYDPHVWHDPSIWADCATYVQERLALFDASHAEDYATNLEAYREELGDLFFEVQAVLEGVPSERRVLVTAHDAFWYFGTAFGFEVQGLQGISTDDETSLSRMEDVIKLLIDRRISAVFVESAVAPRTIEALVEPCRRQGHEVSIPEAVLFADALGPKGTEAATYRGMLLQNARTIAEALQ